MPSHGTNGQNATVTTEQRLEMVVHAGQRLVEFQSRGRFDLTPHSTFVPFDAIEAAYFFVLNERMQARIGAGQIQGQAQKQSGVPVAPSAGSFTKLV